MKTEWIYIFIVALIQGQYDLDFWYGYFKEQSGHTWEWLYRLLKETVDIPVTAAILYFGCKWSLDLINAFFVIKLFGWTDAFYILIWKMFNPKRIYVDEDKGEKIWWMWWTPLAWKRNQIIYSADLSTFELSEIMRLFGKWYLKKGIITKRELYIQLAAGAGISYVMYHFKVIDFIIHKLIIWMY